MTSNLKITHQKQTNQSVALRQKQQQLLKLFWLSVTVLFLVELYTVQTDSIANILGAIAIAFTALFPLYLWCAGKALEMPIFPIFAITFLWTDALPLVSNHPRVVTYSPEEVLFASVTVTGFLGLGTFIWFQFVKSAPTPPKYYRVLEAQNSDGFFLIILAAAGSFTAYTNAGWYYPKDAIYALISGAILGLNVLSVFVLSYRYGIRELSKNKSNIFFALLILYIVASISSLLLVDALSITLLAVIAFIVGRRQLPWLPIILVLICLLPLHSGKGEMRHKYWNRYEPHFVKPWEYPAWYAEWIGYTFDNLDNLHTSDTKEAGKQSFLERASLIHLLLMAQVETPRDVPYLSGATYAILPELLIPRILNQNKIRSHEGTYILDIHYKLQKREDTLITTIGWGLLNEAYANFGLSGCAGLAIILGAAYGQATRWSMNTSLLSSRSFFAVLLMSYAFQSEFSAGVYVAALFQSSVPLVVMTFVFMKVRRNGEVVLISPE